MGKKTEVELDNLISALSKLYFAIPKNDFMSPEMGKAYDNARELLKRWGFEV